VNILRNQFRLIGVLGIRMKLNVYILFICFLLANTARSHDIHLSITEITIDNEGQMDINIRIFLDDLMLACGLIPGEPLPSDYSSADELIEHYLRQQFRVYVDEKLINYKYKTSYSDDMAVGIELMIAEHTSELNSQYVIRNTILLEQFDDQLNLVNIDWNRGWPGLLF